nr:hypothetical protein [Tanacetum cinerariifolium]
MMLHMEKSDMMMLVAEIKVGDKTADDVDKLACSADVVKPRQVDLNLEGKKDDATTVAPRKSGRLPKLKLERPKTSLIDEEKKIGNLLVDLYSTLDFNKEEVKIISDDWQQKWNGLEFKLQWRVL